MYCKVMFMEFKGNRKKYSKALSRLQVDSFFKLHL